MSIRTSFNPLGTLGASPLPPGYVRVESVGSKGSLMDTGIVADFENHVFKCDARFVEPVSSTQQVLLGTSSVAGRRWAIGWIYNNGPSGAWGVFHDITADKMSFANPFERHVFRSEDKGWYIDSVLKRTISSAGYGYTWKVGTVTTNTETMEVRLFGTSVYDKSTGEMLADYVPCRRTSDGKRFMYDTVRGKFADVQGNQLTE